MLQIGYFSSAVGPQSGSVVHEILTIGRRNNLRDGITGFLVAAGNRYLQVIEGPDRPMRALYGKIVSDDRHLAVAKFLERHVSERSFGSWSLAFRRPLAVGEHDNFPGLLRALTADVSDSQLKRQIAYFAQTAVEIHEAETGCGNGTLWVADGPGQHTRGHAFAAA
jgi:hypothetical protein